MFLSSYMVICRMYWVAQLILVISSLACFFNFLGLHMMSAQKTSITLQKYLLVNLSVNEILRCATTLVEIALLENTNVRNIKPGICSHYLQVTKEALFFPFFTVMMLLTQDRFCAAYLHIKYRSSWFRAHAKLLNIIGWCLCGVYIVVLTTISELKHHWLKHFGVALTKVFPVLTMVLIIQCFITYTYVIVVIRRIKNRHPSRVQNNYKELLLCFIILTYVILKGIPDIRYFISPVANKAMSHYLHIGEHLNMLSDPLIYIFMQTNIRLHLTKLSQRFRAFFENLTLNEQQQQNRHWQYKDNAVNSSGEIMQMFSM